MMKIFTRMAILPMLTIMLAGCSKQSTPTVVEPSGTSTEVTKESENPTGLPTEDTTGQSDITQESLTTEIPLSMEDFSFSQKEIKAKVGSTITIKLTNSKGMHDFMIDELKVKSKTLKAGESQDLELKIPSDAKGKTFEYYCSVGQHRKMGMVGKLIIE